MAPAPGQRKKTQPALLRQCISDGRWELSVINGCIPSGKNAALKNTGSIKSGYLT